MTFVAGIREDAKTILIFGIKKSRKKELWFKKWLCCCWFIKNGNKPM